MIEDNSDIIAQRQQDANEQAARKLFELDNAHFYNEIANNEKVPKFLRWVGKRAITKGGMTWESIPEERRERYRSHTSEAVAIYLGVVEGNA